MLKKLSILVDKQSGEEWTVQERTFGSKVVNSEGKTVQLYVYMLTNSQYHKRFVYEHMVDREFERKAFVS
jgi:hypothetical protein